MGILLVIRFNSASTPAFLQSAFQAAARLPRHAEQLFQSLLASSLILLELLSSTPYQISFDRIVFALRPDQVDTPGQVRGHYRRSEREPAGYYRN